MTSLPGVLLLMFSTIFKFLGSIKFAVPLLSAIAIILIGATFYESQVGSTIVQQTIYKSPWFGALMFLLALNLGISALTRYPWRGARKIGFALTHLGLIVIIAGAAAVIHLGMEGMLTLYTDSGASNQIRAEGDVLEVMAPGGETQQTDLTIKPNGSVHPQSFAGLSLLAYRDNTVRVVSFTPGATVDNPAVQLSLSSNRMGQTLRRWLAAAPSAYSRISLGPATLELVPVNSNAQLEKLSSPPDEVTQGRWGTLQIASASGKTLDIDVEQAVTTAAIFSLPSAEPVEKIATPEDITEGTTSLAQAQLPPEVPQTEAPQTEILQTETLQIKLVDFWPDFQLDANNRPITASQEVRNPVVQLAISSATGSERWFLFGRNDFAPIRTVISGTALEDVEGQYKFEPQPLDNFFRVMVTADNRLFYAAQSSKGFSSGALEVGQAVSPGWADFQIAVEELIPQAKLQRQVVPSNDPAADGGPALLVATETGAQTWLPWAEPATISDSEGERFAAFSPRLLQLPFAIALEDFIIDRNEGSDSIAMWTSKIRIEDPERSDTPERKVWMNHPTWYRGWKMAQASWNPNDLTQSTLQVKREPVWVTALTWSGSALVVLGIGVMFYGPALAKKLRRPSSQSEQQSEPSADLSPEPEPDVESEKLHPETEDTKPLATTHIKSG